MLRDNFLYNLAELIRLYRKIFDTRRIVYLLILNIYHLFARNLFERNKRNRGYSRNKIVLNNLCRGRTRILLDGQKGAIN